LEAQLKSVDGRIRAKILADTFAPQKGLLKGINEQAAAIRVLLDADKMAKVLSNQDLVGAKLANLDDAFGRISLLAKSLLSSADTITSQMHRASDQLQQVNGLISLVHTYPELQFVRELIMRTEAILAASLAEKTNPAHYKIAIAEIAAIASTIDENIAALNKLDPKHPKLTEYRNLRDQIFARFDLQKPALDAWQKIASAAIAWVDHHGNIKALRERCKEVETSILMKLTSAGRRDVTMRPVKDSVIIQWKDVVSRSADDIKSFEAELKDHKDIRSVNANLNALLSKIVYEFVDGSGKLHAAISRINQLIGNLGNQQMVAQNALRQYDTEQSDTIRKLQIEIKILKARIEPLHAKKQDVLARGLQLSKSDQTKLDALTKEKNQKQSELSQIEKEKEVFTKQISKISSNIKSLESFQNILVNHVKELENIRVLVSEIQLPTSSREDKIAYIHFRMAMLESNKDKFSDEVFVALKQKLNDKLLAVEASVDEKYSSAPAAASTPEVSVTAPKEKVAAAVVGAIDSKHSIPATATVAHAAKPAAATPAVEVKSPLASAVAKPAEKSGSVVDETKRIAEETKRVGEAAAKSVHKQATNIGVAKALSDWFCTDWNKIYF
jgi:hypothetical protein